MIVYTGAAGYMSDCQTGDLLVAMTAARSAAQLVTRNPDNSDTTDNWFRRIVLYNIQERVPRVGWAVVAAENQWRSISSSDAPPRYVRSR